MPALGSLWYTLGIDSKKIDADLKSVEAKLKNLGVTVDLARFVRPSKRLSGQPRLMRP